MSSTSGSRSRAARRDTTPTYAERDHTRHTSKSSLPYFDVYAPQRRVTDGHKSDPVPLSTEQTCPSLDGASPSFTFPSVESDESEESAHTTPHSYPLSRSAIYGIPEPYHHWENPPPHALRFSGSSTQSHYDSLPRTPVDLDYSSSTRSQRHERFPVVVAAPVLDVEVMDALVDGMNGLGGDENLISTRRLGRPSYLDMPPLPTPPPGVVLGGGKARRPRSKQSKSSLPSPSLEKESLYHDPFSSNRHTAVHTPKSHRESPVADDIGSTVKNSTPKQTPTKPRAMTLSSPPPASAAAILATSEAVQKRFSAHSFENQTKTVAPSISEIIRNYAPPAQQVRSRPSTARSSPYPSTELKSTLYEDGESETDAQTADEDPEDFISRTSMDSIADEVQRTVKTYNKSSRDRSLQHARSFPKIEQSAYAYPDVGISSPRSEKAPKSVYASSTTSTPAPPSPLDVLGLRTPTPEQTIAQYLRSRRLTTLLKLTRAPHASREHPLTISLSDLGDPQGFPLVIFLGLGCVRHIMGLYDEMADALGLRLITIDRWGLGKTDTPHYKSTKGIPEWASVVEEALDQLNIQQCSIMAHSAGAPYALSFANRVPERIVGDICLLAPWVGGGEGGYKWLKYIPNGILRTAQAAEWKLQAWMIGKPPSLTYEGIGYDASTASPITSSSSGPSLKRGKSFSKGNKRSTPPHETMAKPRPSVGSRSVGSSSFSSDYDDLRDFNGRFESRSTLNVAQVSSNSNQNTDKKSKSRRFLGFGKPKNSGNPQSPQSVQAPPMNRLKSLRSMGSLKNKASEPASSTRYYSGNHQPSLPNSPSLAGLEVGGLDLGRPFSPEFSSSADHVSSPRAGDASDRAPRQGHRARRSISLSSRVRSVPSPAASPPSSPVPSSLATSAAASETNLKTGASYQASLANALIAASHAESAKGTHSDLLQILNHDHQPWGFSYTTYPHRARVWYGDRDEKIAENAVRWMERNMGEDRCTVKVVKGADHSLMFKSSVVVEVLETAREFW